MIYTIPEGFKLIPEYEDYACSEEGKILNLKKGRLIKQTSTHSVYTVRLNNKGFSLASIICLTYHGPCSYAFKKIRYKDGDSSNIHYKNLEWHDQEANKKRHIENTASLYSRLYR